MSWIARMRAGLRGLFLRSREDAETDEEMRFHLEMESARLAREAGLSPEEARRRAHVAFGGVERHKESVRDARGLAWLGGFSLDLKLAMRILRKYPGLTIVGGSAMAFGIWLGAGTFELVKQLVDAELPLAEGDRVVGIWHRNLKSAENENPGLHDFATWRSELSAVEDLGAFRTVERNLIVGGVVEPIEVAEVSPSGFDLARVPPLLGRALVEADGQPGAPAVAVIGYDLWQRRFGGDRGVVGHVVQLGAERATVVGVMPEGFAFPVRHVLWTPLRLNPLAYDRANSPQVAVFGRLAPGTTLDQAQAELATLARGTAAEFPETHGHLRPQGVKYTHAQFPIDDVTASGDLYWINLLGVMLMLLMCGNVALLVFARAAARERELIVRSALGASRGRIVAQLFAESLVLGGVAAVAGLAAAGLGLRWAHRLLELNLIQLPFWFDASLSPATVLYVILLTVFGAAVAGIVPALKVTGRDMERRLRQTTVGGSAFRFGGVWTAIIVAQVAVTLAFPVPAFFVGRLALQIRTADAGFPEEEYAAARLEPKPLCDPATCVGGVTAEGDAALQAAHAAQAQATRLELERRLLAEPGVLAVTFADRLPRMHHADPLIEVDDGAAAPRNPDAGGYQVSSASVAPDYFEALGRDIVSGRGFSAADAESEQGVVLVNEAFVRQVFGGRNPVGRRLRYASADEAENTDPWQEIIGVVPDLEMGSGIGRPDGDDRAYPGFYQPLAMDDAGPVHVAVRVRGDAGTFTPRLRAIAAAVDPSLQLEDVGPLLSVRDGMVEFLGLFLRFLLAASGVALLLSLAGIYAIMAFTVSQSTREIGIRIALGASRKRLLAAIFRRPLRQVGLGVVIGGAIAAALASAMFGSLAASDVALVLAYAALMMGVCLLACVVPTRRALRVEPTEALRAE